MSIGLRRPYQAVDYHEVARLFEPPPEYYAGQWLETPERITALQLVRLKEKLRRGYRVPFFKRRWDEAGVSSDDIRSLDDLKKLPTYSVNDLRHNIEQHPPFGDYHALSLADADREPMRAYMSGGTTGRPRPSFYSAWDRAVGSLLLARSHYMRGVRPGDIVLNSWSYGTHNGAHAHDEALYQWLNCVVLTTSTGNVTSTREQVELIREYGAHSVMTTGDYLLRLAEMAREMGLDPKKDLKIRVLPNGIGDREAMKETFGLPLFESYGFHEIQIAGIMCPEHDGVHIFEDAYIMQIVDPETGRDVPEGELGVACVTELYKTGDPQIRLNTMDFTRLYPRQQCGCGSWLRKIAPFTGRADNMVKLRGTNVWPEALFEAAKTVEGVGSDWFVRAVRQGNRDELIFAIDSEAAESDLPALRERVSATIRDHCHVSVIVEIVRPGSLDALTGVNVSPKLKRFKDERK